MFHAPFYEPFDYEVLEDLQKPFSNIRKLCGGRGSRVLYFMCILLLHSSLVPKKSHSSHALSLAFMTYIFISLIIGYD